MNANIISHSVKSDCSEGKMLLLIIRINVLYADN